MQRFVDSNLIFPITTGFKVIASLFVRLIMKNAIKASGTTSMGKPLMGIWLHVWVIGLIKKSNCFASSIILTFLLLPGNSILALLWCVSSFLGWNELEPTQLHLLIMLCIAVEGVTKTAGDQRALGFYTTESSWWAGLSSRAKALAGHCTSCPLPCKSFAKDNFREPCRCPYKLNQLPSVVSGCLVHCFKWEFNL